MPETHEVTDLARRPRRRWLVAGGVFLLVGVWGVAAVASTLLAHRDLQAARSSFLAAESQLRDADLSGARQALATGVAHAEASSARLRHLHLWPLRLVPVAAPNLRAAGAISDAARDSGGAATDLLDVASTIVHDDRESEHGEISIDYLGDLAPVLRHLADTLVRSTAEVEAVDSPRLLGAVERARTSYLQHAGSVVEQAVLAADLAEVMPRFLGEESPRTYLLMAAASSELRASGGLLGSWSLLTADGGRLDFGDFRDIDELAALDGHGRDVAEVAAPSQEFAARYAESGGLREPRNANMTPDFPSAATVLLSLWEARGGGPLDGVIVADTVTFQRLVERSGPLEVPGVTTLTAANTLDFVALEAYAAFEDENERKRVLGEVAVSAFRRVFDILDDDDVPATVAMLHDLAQGGHLRIFSRDQVVQPVLVRAGVAGELPEAEGEFVAVFVNNAAANKVDYFTTRRLEHRVVLRPGGQTRSTIEVEFVNRAPREGYPRNVLGPWTPHTEAGDNLSLVSLYCGYRCAADPIPRGATDGGTELGRPVVDVALLVPAGETRALRYHTTTADGWSRDEEGHVAVRITHLVQPTLHPTPLRVVVPLPDGWEPRDLPEGAQVEDGDVVWEETTSGKVELVVRLAPTDTAAATSVP